MAKERIPEHRYDFSGGLNTSVSPDRLGPTELVQATNARLATSFGAIAKRTGTRRMHTTALGSPSPIRGLVQWDSPSGKQLVAIANGRLHHKTTDFGEFAQVVPATLLSTTTPQQFAPMRSSSAGAPLRLYIADGTVQRWDGTAITRIDGTASVPNADLIAAYHTRMFYRDADLLKHLFWSKVGDPEVCTTGGPTDGGQALVDTLTGEEIMRLRVVGSALVIPTGDSIAAFRGYSSDDIQIAQDTEGISGAVGIVGRLALEGTDKVAFTLSDAGVYAVTENAIQKVSTKINPSLNALDRTLLATACVGYHRGRQEIWVALATQVFVYSLELQAWYGPFTYAFPGSATITCLARFEDSTGDEWIIAGCSDGFVRHLDTGALDDVLANGTGGSAYTMTVELAPMLFGRPETIKLLSYASVQADLTASCALKLGLSTDGGAFTDYDVTFLATGAQSYPLNVQDKQGRRVRVRFTDASSDIPIINGLTINAYDSLRR
jgi:hypothetical protein